MKAWILPLALMLGAAPATAQTVTEPSDAWNITFGADNRGCEISQPFASLGKKAVILLEISPVSGAGQMSLHGFDKIADETVSAHFGDVTKKFESYREDPSVDHSKKYLWAGADGALLMGLETAHVMQIDARTPVQLDVAAFAKALHSIRGCQDALLRSWKLDPAAVRAVATQPVPNNPGSWLDGTAYNERMLQRLNQGVVALLLAVRPDGKVADCKQINAAAEELAIKTCAAAIGRGSFKPGLDAQGKPIASWYVFSVNWMIQDAHLPPW